VLALATLFVIDISRQPTSGRGWVLLAQPFREIEPKNDVVLVRDGAALAAGWSAADQAEAPPSVDFGRVIVVRFTQLGGGCPLRFDGLLIDPPRHVVAGLFSTRGIQTTCSAVGAPYSFLVAIDRAVLPHPGVRIQLNHPLAVFGEPFVDIET
jgi:hypothetical protein